MVSVVGGQAGAAMRIGITLAEYLEHRNAGEHWCGDCRTWKYHLEFNVDRTRSHGVKQRCRDCQRTRNRTDYLRRKGAR